MFVLHLLCSGTDVKSSVLSDGEQIGQIRKCKIQRDRLGRILSSSAIFFSWTSSWKPNFYQTPRQPFLVGQTLNISFDAEKLQVLDNIAVIYANKPGGTSNMVEKECMNLTEGQTYTKRGSAFSTMQDWASWVKLVSSEFAVSPN
jgi:hypothetical protein